MTRYELRALLEAVQTGALTPEAAQDRLLQFVRQAPFEDLGFARVDHHRRVRQGFPEVIYGPGKTPDQIAAIASRIVAAGHSLLVTRTNEEAYRTVTVAVADAVFNPVARTITRAASSTARGKGIILVATAGTADLPVAEEAAVSAEIMGNEVDRLYDVGVSGLHRLLAEQARLVAAHVVIVVAGMEGALPSVVGGLVDVPVVAVPTSVGYGASFGGITALLAMLNSCASGVSVVNIDNGFGAAAVASAINHLPDAARVRVGIAQAVREDEERPVMPGDLTPAVREDEECPVMPGDLTPAVREDEERPVMPGDLTPAVREDK